jgi:hypothetical protein
MTTPLRAVAIALTMGTFGCSAAGGSGEESLPDQRVIDGVAPVSGDSMGSVRWLNERLFRMRLPFVTDCLEEAGHPELVPTAEADFRQFNETYSAEFPEPERMLEKGLIPAVGPVAFQGAAPGATPTAAEQSESDAFYRCTRSPEIANSSVQRADDLYHALYDQWGPIIVEHVRGGSLDQAAIDDFGACLRANGVPADLTVGASTPMGGDSDGMAVSTAEDTFLRWVTDRTLAGTISTTAHEDVPLYVECGQPLWDAREIALQREREAFTERHRDAIAELSDLVISE